MYGSDSNLAFRSRRSSQHFRFITALQTHKWTESDGDGDRRTNDGDKRRRRQPDVDDRQTDRQTDTSDGGRGETETIDYGTIDLHASDDINFALRHLLYGVWPSAGGVGKSSAVVWLSIETSCPKDTIKTRTNVSTLRTPSQTIVWANPNSEQAGCQLSTICWNSAVSTMAGSFGSRPEVNSLQKVEYPEIEIDRGSAIWSYNIADVKLQAPVSCIAEEHQMLTSQVPSDRIIVTEFKWKPDIRGRFTEDRDRLS
ncbi:hypothetical protein L210DRAFT_3631884 [Boletus edulis BED1]|uniref:Uncharacterized protein n=1 Tax=Boletus edulis BED1 TaxID=1328754 RepID=A0AAD4BQN8_BOLED|nr:hypothetical protein L210DRAFT_3631884 [Boletus edulis BED1]